MQMLRSVQVDEVYTFPSLLQAQERTLKCGSKHPWFFSTLAPTCLVNFWMAHFSESSYKSQKWLLSVNFYSPTSKNFAQQSQNHLLGNDEIQHGKSHPGFLMRQEYEGAKSGYNLHFVLLRPHLHFTNIWKKIIPEPTGDKRAWMTNTREALPHPHPPRRAKPTWDAFKPWARSAAPRDDAKVTLCNGAISWYWDRWRCKSCIFSADITNQTSKQIG